MGDQTQKTPREARQGEARRGAQPSHEQRHADWGHCTCQRLRGKCLRRSACARFVCVRAYVYVYVCACVCACVCARVRVRVRVCAYVSSVSCLTAFSYAEESSTICFTVLPVSAACVS